MSTIKQSATRSSSNTALQRRALDAARSEVLRKRIAWHGSLHLNAQTYRDLRWEGFSRRDVDRAVEALVLAGEAAIETSSGTVRVRLVGPREGGE
jgi:hypothetical protein